MVTDIKGPASMRTRVGDKRADEVLAVHDGLIREQLACDDGIELKTAGEGSSASRSIWVAGTR